ncbi:uncharacterized protein BJ212DRAFT_1302798 [Suillus subaureus]|uniref:Uncharacterized protein n=1 Tax=Suillus subaureus TaxID=48587 RepID=A0A9P7J8J9_9AGAM|nr:uncharacterized protein BJ212DRAFT_1302798 [Suillus subaureus]KAG1808897.1 hypothetical protein BJ212DRAFT_1302798 [Suillus subaureus]
MPPPKDPIALTMTTHNESMADVLLTYLVEMADEDNVTMLSLGNGKTKIKVPVKCINLLAVTMCVLEVFGHTTNVLIDHPEIPVNNPDVQFYLALVSYIASVITTFIHKVEDDGAKATKSNWWSAALDYHITLILENSAFASTYQRVAEQKMNCTWADFRVKKYYKRIKLMTHQSLHKALCSDGDDLCGGPFVHKCSIDEVIKVAIVDIDAMRATAASSSVTEPAVIDARHWYQLQNLRKSQNHGVTMYIACRPVWDLNLNFVNKPWIQSQRTSEHVVTIVECQEVRKKPVKAHKTKKQAPSKKGKGKAKAPPKVLVINSSDEISNVSSTNKTFPSVILSDNDDPPPLMPPSASWRTDFADVIPNIRLGMNTHSGLNDGPLPSLLPKWDTWHRTAFEQGNPQVFLKLVTWMLLRFHQLTMTDMNTDVNDVVIPLNPRTIPFENDDDFLEALGMECLYAAIIHMETCPHYLSHLLQTHFGRL